MGRWGLHVSEGPSATYTWYSMHALAMVRGVSYLIVPAVSTRKPAAYGAIGSVQLRMH